MGKMDAWRTWLKEKLSKLGNGDQRVDLMIPKAPAEPEYIVYLFRLCTDIGLTNLAATVNHLYSRDYEKGDVRAIYERHTGHVFNDTFIGPKTDKDYNEPIAKLATCRRAFDDAMDTLGRPFEPDAPCRNDRRRYVVPSLKQSGYDLHILSLRDISPSDLDKIYEAQERIRMKRCDKKGLSYNLINGRASQD
ncbi:MAG: hypothetical protein Q9168_006454 [Polycauliona sp. 1 TL-2023]